MTGISRTMACHASLFVALLLALQSPSVSAFQPRLSPPPQAPSHHSTRREFVKTRLFQSTKTDGEQSTAASTSATSSSWKPTIQSLSDRKTYFRQQREQSSLLSSDSQMERLGTLGFHHMEFYTGDALMTAKRFELALGMPITCWSSLATGNDVCVTYGLECGVKYDGEGRVVDGESGEGVRFLVTAPLSRALNRQRRNENGTKSDERNSGSGSGGQSSSQVQMTAPLPLPGYDVEAAHEFYSQHGLGVRAVGIEVRDATSAYENAVANGAIGVLEPTIVPSFYDDKSGKECHMAEVKLYGDVVLRLVSFHSLETVNDNSESSNNDNSQTSGSSSPPKPFLPHLAPYPSHNPNKPTYGLTRLDHTVGNVPDLLATQNYIQSFTNYHPFAEFTPEDVGTVDSGLNSVVLASDNEAVLLPLNEPTEGKRKSQIQTFLEQNEGPGLQHIAIKTNDIFSTIEQMRHAEENFGGFELMKRPSEGYYRELPERLGDKLTEEQYERLEELGILADADDEGVLLQIFTKPLGDRPTVFIEIIQRIGCVLDQGNGMSGNDAGKEKKVKERPGCGGFGQGNFRELFKAIEDHEKTLKV